MSEIVFLVEEDPEGGFTARALGESIFTQADDMKSLREAVRDAVNCIFQMKKFAWCMIINYIALTL